MVTGHDHDSDLRSNAGFCSNCGRGTTTGVGDVNYGEMLTAPSVRWTQELVRSRTAVKTQLGRVTLFFLFVFGASPARAAQANLNLPQHATPESSDTSPNPRSKVFAASADLLFKAALRSAARHHIIRTEDNGLKDLDDKGQEILSFGFATRIRGFTHGVIAEVEVTPVDSGSSRLTIFYYRLGRQNAWIPSASLELREAQLEANLQKILDDLDFRRSALEMRYEAGGISLSEKLRQEGAIEDQRFAATRDEIKQKHDAEVADLAQMPTSTFPAMFDAAGSFFDSVDRNLVALKHSN
jgi:hypothetical protein